MNTPEAKKNNTDATQKWDMSGIPFAGAEKEKSNPILAINQLAEEISINPENLTSNHAISFLRKVNGIVNSKPTPSDITENMGIGALPTGAGSKEYVAPNRQIREKVIEDYIAKFNEVEDTDTKAQLAYHGIINLHLFEDGNGRTARSTYLLLKNHGLTDNDDVFVTHNYKENNSQDFEEQYSLTPTEQLNYLAEREIINTKIASDELAPQFRKAETYSFGLPDNDDLTEKGLTQGERELLITTIFPDNHLAGIATGMLIQKNTPQNSPIIDLNTRQSDEFSDHKRIIFTHRKTNPERYQSVYGKMNAEEYRNLISIYNQIKIEQNQNIANLIANSASEHEI